MWPSPNAEGYPNHTHSSTRTGKRTFRFGLSRSLSARLSSLLCLHISPRFFGRARSTAPLPTMAERIKSFDLGAKIRPSFSKLRRGAVRFWFLVGIQQAASSGSSTIVSMYLSNGIRLLYCTSRMVGWRMQCIVSGHIVLVCGIWGP